MSDFTEEEIIALFHGPNFRTLDDCAWLEHKGPVTTDSLCEGTHFKLDYFSAKDLAWKLFHCNASDLAASGARPEWVLLNLGLPKNMPHEFLKELALNFRNICDSHCVAILGGDTFAADSLFLSATMGGSALRHLERAKGQPGDLLCLTGNTGLSLLGLQILGGKQDIPEPLKKLACDRHLRPQARIEEGLMLAQNPGVHACLDISDGLARDAERLACASSIALEIDVEKLPDPYGLGFKHILESGEEYELLFLMESSTQLDLKFQIIGRALQSGPALRLLKNGKELTHSPSGFVHFRPEA